MPDDLDDQALETYIANSFARSFGRNGGCGGSSRSTREEPRMSMTPDELRFYGPIPSAVSRWILLSFWPTVLLVACLYWWLG